MTSKEIAQKLDGIEYPVRIPKEIVAAAKQGKIVIVYGASDDLMEFEGAIDDEVGAYGGATVRVDSEGLIPDFEQLVEEHDKEALREYFRREESGKTIEALWCKEGGYSWTYKTDIPCETFEILDDDTDGGKYCRGIVFSLADV